jgi:hypothetical protein
MGLVEQTGHLNMKLISLSYFSGNKKNDLSDTGFFAASDKAAQEIS